MIRRIHKWVGLVCLAFWLVQALTGVAILFRWEIDDALLRGARAPLDPPALGARIEQLRLEGSDVSSAWASSGPANRFDIFHSRDGRDLVTRVDGSGAVLRNRGDERLARGGVWDTLTRVHQNLLSGDVGKWIVGLSGVLLVTNIVLGLRMAWPRRGTARTVLLRKPKGPPQAQAYGWHRMLGLWLGFPALALASAGVLLVFHHEVEEALRAEHEPAAAPAIPAGAQGIGPGEAIARALARYPGARLSGISLPDAETPQYRIRLNVPGETPRIYGVTTVVLAQADGRVLLDYDARRPTARRAFVDTLYPFHTGQWLALPGRLVSLAVGLWLVAMIVLGVQLWRRRRALRRPQAPGRARA